MTLDEIRAAYATMTPDERRAALPDWFEGGLDPSYPEREELNYKDDEEDKKIGIGIADRMERFELHRARRSGIKWQRHAAAIQRLVEVCRIIYYPTYKHWLSGNAPEGSRWRPWRTLGRNDTYEGPRYDYSEWLGPTAAAALRELGYTSWGQLFTEDYEKAINPAKGRRPSKLRPMQYGLGIFEDRLIGVAPMQPVYELAKRFYLEVLGMRAFRPEFPFTGDVVGTEYDNDKEIWVKRLGGNRSRAAKIKRDDMNTAAKFLSLVLKEVDFYFGERQAGLVARAFYKRT